MKRSPMPRSTKPLERRTPMPRRRSETPAERRFRLTVSRRARGVCEAQVEGVCWHVCDPLFIQAHHIGGRVGQFAHDPDVNGLACCPPCHDWIGAHTDKAVELGLAARRNGIHNPATTGRPLGAA